MAPFKDGLVALPESLGDSSCISDLVGSDYRDIVEGVWERAMLIAAEFEERISLEGPANT